MSRPKLITEYFVRPMIEVEESKRVHHLNPLGLKWLPLHCPQLGFLHSKPSTFTPSSFLNHFRSALSHTLVFFYPLAGQLVTVPNPNLNDRSCYVYVDCSIGRGVRLVHASAPELTVGCIVGVGSDVPRVVRFLFDLGEVSVNHDGHTRPLVSVQVTELRDGVFVGFCINHVLVDGISIFHFLRVLSHVFMGTLSSSSTPLPVVKQPGFLNGRVFSFDPSEFITGSSNKFVEPELSRRFFQFSPESLKTIKSIANYSDPTISTISTFLSLIAFVWKCITRVRNLNPDDPTECAVPINLRPRFNPPLTDDYFGNYAVRAVGSTKAGDLLTNSLGWAATLLQQAITASTQDNKAARAFVSQTTTTTTHPPVGSSTNLTVAGSTRFDLNETRFGLGRLVAFRNGYVNKVDGKVNAYLGSGGDGGVDLDICLAPDTMTDLLLDREFTSFASLHTGHFDLISRI